MRPPLTPLELRVLRKERARRSRVRMEARGVPTRQEILNRQNTRQAAWSDQRHWGGDGGES